MRQRMRGYICFNLNKQCAWQHVNYVPCANSSNITCIGGVISYNGTSDGISETNADIKYLNLSGRNANQNINITPYNLTTSKIIFTDGEYITTNRFDTIKIYSENDIQLLPYDEVIIDGDVNPATNMARYLGSLTTMWKEIFTADLTVDDYIIAKRINITGDIIANSFNGSS